MVTAKQRKLALQKGGKPGDVAKFVPVTAEKIMEIDLTRAKRNGWLEEELAANPNHETNMYLTKGLVDPLVDRSCMLLDGNCNCECPESDCKYSGKPWPKRSSNYEQRIQNNE
jgi:hypothetical protein